MHIESAEFVKGIKGTNDILDDGIPEIAFVGRSNVGKSSVINALLNRRDLARSGNKPGKTMEINFYFVNKRAYFVDLPGYGYARGTAFEKGKIRKLIIWYLTSGEAKPVTVVLIVDARVGFTEFDREAIAMLREVHHPCIIVANKVDKLNQKELAQAIGAIKRESGVPEVFLHSAETKQGTEELRERLLANI